MDGKYRGLRSGVVPVGLIPIRVAQSLRFFLQCPLGNLSWNSFFSGTKYRTALMESTYKTKMKLTIVSVTSLDFGTYQCVSKNLLGETDGTIKLYGTYLQQISPHKYGWWPLIILIILNRLQIKLLVLIHKHVPSKKFVLTVCYIWYAKRHTIT